MVGLSIWLPLVICAAVIWFISQYGTVPDLTPWLTAQHTMIAGHIGLYACLGFFAARYLAFGLRLPGVLVLVFSTALCATLGIADELHQRLVEGRSADLDDLLADFVGGFIGSLVYLGLVALTRRIRSAEDREAVAVDIARPKRALGLALILLVLLPMFMYSGIPASVFRFVTEGGGLPAIGVLGQHIQSSPTSDPEKQSVSADHAAATEGKVIPRPATTLAQTEGSTASEAPGDQDRPVGETRVASLPPDKTAEASASSYQQAPGPEKQEPPGSAEYRKGALPRELAHLAALYKELADLETKEIQFIAYGLDYPPRAALRAQMEVFRERILQIESRPVPPEVAARIRSEYVLVFKEELSRLEIKELRMSKYSRQYPPRALLREKIDFLRKKIAHTDERSNDE